MAIFAPKRPGARPLTAPLKVAELLLFPPAEPRRRDLEAVGQLRNRGPARLLGPASGPSAAHAAHTVINIDAADIADLPGSPSTGKTLSFGKPRRLGLTSCLPASLIITSLSLVTENARPSEEGRVVRVG